MRDGITLENLENAKPENVVRLAKSLGLCVDGMDHEVVVDEVFSLLREKTTRFDSPKKREAYEAFWAELE